MTNTISIVTLLVTNWVATGDVKRQNGTNYVQLQCVVTPQTMIEEVMLCTNRTLYKVGVSVTNGVKWDLRPVLCPPPLPLPPSPSLGAQ